MALAWGLAGLMGCSSPRVCLTPEQKVLCSEVSAIDPWEHPITTNTAIIDVHTHTFNARYLPLRGILLGKRDAKPPLTWLISDRCAALIAQGLIDRTELAELPGLPGVKPAPDTRALRSTNRVGFICNLVLSLLDEAIEKNAWDKSTPIEGRMANVMQVAAHMNLAQRIVVQVAAAMMGMDRHTRGGKRSPEMIKGTEAAVLFIWTLTQSEDDLIKLFHMVHADAPKNGPITMISHMMDLGPVYNQPPEGQVLLDFPTNQVRRMVHYQNQSGSNLLYFVAYNPYRSDYTNDGSPGALDVVRDAVQHHGAKGVKVYPPSGYRPAANEIKASPIARATRYPGRQWEARYKWLGSHANAALDAELNSLLEWCLKYDVPVFTHSGYGEFEARTGYGEHHANPDFWAKFLEAHSRPDQPCQLRLCFGHAGGSDYWFGTGGHKAWGRQVYNLCTRYPNVYCEITTGEELVSENERAYFVDRLAKCFAESDAAAKTDVSRFPFASKLMYGTDWPLPDKGVPARVLLNTQKAFLHPLLKPAYSDYFSGNARRYLKLLP